MATEMPCCNALACAWVLALTQPDFAPTLVNLPPMSLSGLVRLVKRPVDYTKRRGGLTHVWGA